MIYKYHDFISNFIISNKIKKYFCKFFEYFNKEIILQFNIGSPLQQIKILLDYITNLQEENEIYYQNIKSMFNPYNPFIKRELDNYEKIILELLKNELI